MTEALSLGDERDRLDAQLDDYADRIADGDDTQAVTRLANECETRLAGVVHLCEEFGGDATVMIAPLTAGDFARVEDRVQAKREREPQDSLPGYRRNVFVESGLADAPFYDGDADYEQRLATVARQPVGVVKWLESRINDATSVASGDFRGLGERLRGSSEG